MLDLAVGPLAADAFWVGCLKSVTRRGLRAEKLVVSNTHVGLKAAMLKLLKATWQRCGVHFTRNVLAQASLGHRQSVAALTGTVLAQETPDAVQARWGAL